MSSVNYRGVSCDENYEIDCSPESHKELIEFGDNTCDTCNQALTPDSPTGCVLNEKQYMDLKADRHAKIDMIKALAARWSELHHYMEQSEFSRQARCEDGDYGPEFDSDEEQAEYEARQRLKDQMEQLELDSIEEKLDALGARMMRPYEHWNEDERYMEMMESGHGDY